jgi:hypothetical protein
LILGALFALVIAGAASLSTFTSAFAHNAGYTKSVTCGGSWTAVGKYLNGTSTAIGDRRLVVLHDAKVNGALVDGSSASGLTFNQNFTSGPDGTTAVVLNTAYTASGVQNVLTGATISATDYVWVGAQSGTGTLFSLSGGTGTFNPLASAWGGTITLYSWNGTSWVSTGSGNDAAITKPSASEDCIQINISEGACSGSGFNFHFNAPQGTEGGVGGGTLTVSYKYDNGAPETPITKTEDTDGNGHPDWHVLILFNGHGSITILGASSSGGGLWTGNGSSLATVSSTQCAPPTGTIIVKKVRDPGAPAADGSLFNGTIDAAGDWGATGIGFGGAYTKTGLSVASHNVKETSTQNAWTLVGYKLYANGSANTVCSTTKADYTNATPATGAAAAVVAGQTTVVCVMNTKTAEVVHRYITVCKVVDDNHDSVNNGGAFTFTVKAGATTLTSTLSITANESNGANGVCAQAYLIPDNSQTSQVTVKETGKPLGWVDFDGTYPKYKVNGGSVTSGDTADAGSTTDNDTVTFYNKTQQSGTGECKIPVSISTANSVISASGHQTTTYDYSYVIDADGAADGNTTNHHWVQVTGTNQIVWDLGAGFGSKVWTMFPSIDHTPAGSVTPSIPNTTDKPEAIESALSGSNDLSTWENGVLGTVYPAGFDAGWVSDDFASEWTFTKDYRYVRVTLGGPGALQNDGDAEIDAICANKKDPTTKRIEIEKDYLNSQTTQPAEPTIVGLPAGAVLISKNFYSGPPARTVWIYEVPASFDTSGLTETPAAGWHQIDCDEEEEELIGVGDIQTAELVRFCNEPLGKVIVHKVYLGPVSDPTVGFTGDLFTGSTSIGSYTGLKSTAPQTFNNVLPGTHHISEDPKTGYVFIGIGLSSESACFPKESLVAESPSLLRAIEALTNPGPNFNVNPDQTVNVYICNQATGTVVLIKNETHQTAGSETWHFTTNAGDVAGGTPSLTTAANGGTPPAVTSATHTYTDVTAGTYIIDEVEGRRLCLSGDGPDNFETRAATKIGVAPTDAETTLGTGVIFTVLPGQTTYIRFDNVGCGTVLGTSTIIVKKYSDYNGDFLVNGLDAPIAGWNISISGPGIVGTQTQPTDAGGQTVFAGLGAGVYTITEANGAPAYIVVGSNQGVTNTAGVTASVSLALEETKTVVFHNRPVVGIRVHKAVVSGSSTTNGASWTFTLTGCGITPQAATTDASGNASFSNLPPAIGCTYTVTESQQAGYTASTPFQTTNPTAAGDNPLLTFVNTKNDPGCVTNCANVVPTPTTVPPTVVPPTPTTVPPISTVQGEKTPGPVQTIAGEKTPGPPQTGSGLGSQSGSINIFLAVVGLLVLSAGLALVAVGRGKNRA